MNAKRAAETSEANSISLIQESLDQIFKEVKEQASRGRRKVSVIAPENVSEVISYLLSVGYKAEYSVGWLYISW